MKKILLTFTVLTAVLLGEDMFDANKAKRVGDAYETISDETKNMKFSDKAQEYYKKAANMYLSESVKGNVEAYIKLHSMYLSGEGVKRDHQKADEFLKKAADAGDVQSQMDQAKFNIMFSEDNNKIEEAVSTFQELANRENAKARSFLASIYYNGELVKKDTNKAIKLYKMSARQGNKTSKNMLKFICKEHPSACK